MSADRSLPSIHASARWRRLDAGCTQRRRSRTPRVLLPVLLILVATMLAASGEAGAAGRQPGDYWLQATWGASGAGDGQFADLVGVDVGPDGIVFVADGGNSRVQWFSAAGSYLGKYGVQGSGQGEFGLVKDLAVDLVGRRLYVLDHHDVHQFSIGPASSSYQLTWQATWGAGNSNTGIAVGGGSVYVTDIDTERVWHFSLEGVAQGDWGGSGSGNGQFNDPDGIAVAPPGSPHAGRVYVADTGNRRVQYFEPPFTAPGYGYQGQWTVDSSLGPMAIDVGPDGLVYVCGLFAPRCRQYTPSGGAPPGTTGTPAGAWSAKMVRPWGIAAGSDGTVYVADTSPHPEDLTDCVKAFRRDAAAPTTTDDAPHGSILTAAGWSRQDPLTVTLTRADGLSGVWDTSWQVDGGGLHTQSFIPGPDECIPPALLSSPVTLPSIAGQGLHTLEHWSEDNASNVEGQHNVTFGIDSIAPVTDDDLNGQALWSRSPVTVNFSAFDPVPQAGVAISGLAATQWSVNGGATWQMGGSATVSAEGEIAVLFRSIDVAGNVETPGQCLVRTDFSAPVTGDDAPRGWSRKPVTVHLSARDTKAGVSGTSGVWQINQSLSGPFTDAVWTVGTDRTIEGQGQFDLTYYATDYAGNVEAQKTCRVRIDTGRPVPKALSSLKVKRGGTAKLRCRVNDTWSPTCKVEIRIVKRGKVVKRLKVGSRKSNARFTRSFRCTLPKGSYRWQVYATDLAGNTQAKPGTNRLVVR